MIKQKVNDICNCGSNKKFKKCCMKTQTITYQHKQPHIQNTSREIIHQLNKHIKVPHCIICGDTHKDGNLIHTNTDEGTALFCQYCYDCQLRM
jgi:hypothetical protein